MVHQPAATVELMHHFLWDTLYKQIFAHNSIAFFCFINRKQSTKTIFQLDILFSAAKDTTNTQFDVELELEDYCRETKNTQVGATKKCFM